MSAPIDKILFLAASNLSDPDERDALLDQACKDDPTLRRRVERIIEIQEAAAEFFEAGPEMSSPVAPGGEEEKAGGMLGRYRLIERIGSGGHGIVYLAEQCEPVRRKVALKIIRLGMDTENVIARFELERQALAMMDHPNIARVLDAGATGSGRPYFVMELVDGEKLTDFCDAKRLGISERLELFVQVCHAIQHAHQKGVIHRDIKPSNILVRRREDRWIPKVIDFGIAKATTKRAGDDATLTTGDQFIGTPAYMSPEIAEGGDDIDTRTDIHSLGAVLYELLTGRPPIDPVRLKGLSMNAIRRILRDEDPAKPSQLLVSLPSGSISGIAMARNSDSQRLMARLKGDLDLIVMKALDRDRNRRYQTAIGLATDIKRYLADEPVDARPPDRMYRLKKLVRRNQMAFAFGGTVGVLLACGFGVSTWLFIREKEARNEQERLRLEANQARDNESALRELAEFRELVAQAAVEIGYGRVEEADRLLSEVPIEFAPPSLEAARAYTAVGEWLVLDGRWDEATDRFGAAALTLANVDSSDSEAISIALIPAAATLSLAGDGERYDRLRKVAIDRFGETSHPIVAEQVVKSALLMPADDETLANLRPLADFLEHSINQGDEEMLPSTMRTAWGSFAIALMHFRSGDPVRAADWAARSLRHEETNPSLDASAQVLMAMARWKRGHKDDAVKLLEQAGDAIEEVFSRNLEIGDANSFWFDWVNARVLLNEAHALIAG